MPAQKTESELGAERRRHPRRSVAVPVKLRISSGHDNLAGSVLMACTLDITNSGARLLAAGLRLQAGQIITLERGRERATFEVMWVAPSTSPAAGQFGIRFAGLVRPLW